MKTILESRRPGKSTADRSDLEARLQKLLDSPIEFVFDPSFEHPEVAETLCNVQLPETTQLKSAAANQYLSRLGEVPLLRKQEEYWLFARMNFLKYKAKQLLEKTNPRRCSATRIREIESLLAESVVVRNHLTRANLRLVVSLAKKYADSHSPFEDLVSEGHLPLMRSIELFNFGLGYRFSTYATWAIRNHLIRVLQEEQKKRSRLEAADAEVLPEQESTGNSPEEVERLHNSRRQRVEKLLDQLSDRERQIIAARFGLSDYGREQSLSEIGRDLGISKERVRQLTIRAIERLGKACVPSCGD